MHIYNLVSMKLAPGQVHQRGCDRLTGLRIARLHDATRTQRRNTRHIKAAIQTHASLLRVHLPRGGFSVAAVFHEAHAARRLLRTHAATRGDAGDLLRCCSATIGAREVRW